MKFRNIITDEQHSLLRACNEFKKYKEIKNGFYW